GSRLLVVIHHLVVDGVSWRILFEDLQTLLEQRRQGQPLVLPPKTDAFKTWAEKLQDYATSGPLLAERAYWAGIGTAKVKPLRKDYDAGPATVATTASVAGGLSQAETELLLTRVNGAFSTEINDLLLVALGLALRQWLGQEQVLIALEGHGREEIFDLNISRTVGWFTSLYPVLLDVSHGNDLVRQIKAVKESLRRIPQRGMGYGSLKYAALGAGANTQGPEPEIIFNYLGQFRREEHSLFRFADEPAGDRISKKRKRPFALEINGIITDGRLEVTTAYSKEEFNAATIEAFVSNYEASLRAVIGACREQAGRHYTPSDFTYKGLSIEAVDQLTARHAVEDVYPLSPTQQGILYHFLLDQTSSAYWVETSFRMLGQFDAETFRQSFNVLVSRHAILRTFFRTNLGPVPLQVVNKAGEVNYAYRDLSTLPEEEQHAIVRQEKSLRAQKPDLLADDHLLLQLLILKTASGEHQVVIFHDHILFDGWSLNILLKEVFYAYIQLRAGRPLALRPAGKYGHYISWLTGQAGKHDYWKQYLAGYHAPTVFPGAGPAVAKGEKCEQWEEFRIDGASVAALNVLTSSQHTSLYSAILAVWGIMLGRHNKTADVVFGQV
ncbi:MAG: non-ribosomal peptide synthetase, partial [Cytophagales bacterium]|nr:non-ribosomal peptide synthetase [Cytophagales bacterium]